MQVNDIVLDVKDLAIEFHVDKEVIKAVNHISFKVRQGKTLGLVGETGAGKTTTAKAIMRLTPIPPGVIRSGDIHVCGRDVLHMDKRELGKFRGKEISMIFQDPMTALNPVLTVGEQIAESIRLHEHLNNHEAQKRAGEMLEIVGIPANRANDYPHQFSGGMKQRVVIALALACNPKLLIADEPTTALDVTIQAQVLELMRKIRDEYQMAMIMITHDLGIVAEICDEVAVMYAGHIVEHGTLEDVFLRTKHPYTEGLFNSLPDISNRSEPLKPIPGMMPNPADLPAGCAFAPRCAYATEKCRAGIPPEIAFSDTHFALCSAYEDPGFCLKGKKKDE